MNLLETTVEKIAPKDMGARAEARARLERLTMPRWALGRLMDLAEELAGMTSSMHPPMDRKVVAVMAADHGVVAEGVSSYPQEVTAQMVHAFSKGQAGISALARLAGARVVVVDMGVAGDLGGLASRDILLSKRLGPGTRNIAQCPAMSRSDAVRSLEAGIEVALELGSSTDLFATGDMGIGNTTASSALVAAVTGLAPERVTGRGAGLSDEQLSRKTEVIRRSLAVNQPDATDGIDLLAKVGGFEIGGVAGLVLGAASIRKPVLLDGFVTAAGALIAQSLAPASADYLIASHRSVELGHEAALNHLGLKPLLDLDLRLGEGTGAALAMHLIEAAVRILTEVSTFEEAGVSKAVR